MRWFAKGERELYADDAQLAYVTSVELFFSSPDPGTATSRFCKGFAFALADDPKEVVRLARFAKSNYAIRSETSHAGVFEFVRHDGSGAFRPLALECLARMAQQQFNTRTQVDEWIRGREEALDAEHRELLEDAIRHRSFMEDSALNETISVLRESAGLPWRSEAHRLRYAFSQLLVDACRDRKFLLQLRQFADQLRQAVTSTEDPDLRVAAARAVLAPLDWVERSLTERMNSDFT